MSSNKVIRLFGLSKGTVYYKRRGYPQNRKSLRVQNKEQENVILDICKDRATYGVPRVRAIANRDYGQKMSFYKVRRVMKEKNLLIEKVSNPRKSREHTGKVMVPFPNTRWSSDITSIKLWDGTKVRFSYILDCCDRSIIAYRLGKRMQASDIELMLEQAIYSRFPKGPNSIKYLEFLHDNGPEYTELKLQKQLKAWGIKNCNTPTYSPQSNGMCEAFNGTFKRDYVYQNCLDDFDTLKGTSKNNIYITSTYYYRQHLFYIQKYFV